MNPTPPPVDRFLRVRGTVQGVGFRPFVLRVATELGVQGWVRNDTQGVLVRAIGDPGLLTRLADDLAHRAPPASCVLGVEWLEEIPAATEPVEGFAIVASGAATGEIETAAPVDLTPCPDCRGELIDPAGRRHDYPFINCTQCGPRYTIIERLPYDRPHTTMACFRQCPDCQREYETPTDRRFHAEPNACPTCGPHLQLHSATGDLLAERGEALAQSVRALIEGQIVAVKGVGGFHLMVDATNDGAVARLRLRKHREEKPFAVMFRDLAAVRTWAVVPEHAASLLGSPQGPIILVKKRVEPVGEPNQRAGLAAGVAPDNPWLGALLPPSPLHLLLMARVHRPLVATSANLTDEPLCTDNDEALRRLGGIADLFLVHNRVIARPVDDSVMRFTASNAPIVLRRARGYAPAPLLLPGLLDQPIACVGAQMKNTVAVATGRQLVLSPHIGDLGGVATHGIFTRTLKTLADLLGTRVQQVVCDKHPDYNSSVYAEICGLPRIAVQHHLAHVLAVLLEHNHPADDVLGVAWDGTGYGEDGTIWGGEFIRLQGGRAERFARLRPFRLPGGEAAVRDARRVALAMAPACGITTANQLATRLGFPRQDAANLEIMVRQHLNSPLCTSMGRLFDGFGALLGLGARNTFEGQLPLAVETAATAASPTGASLPFPVRPCLDGARWEIDWAPALAPLLAAAPAPAKVGETAAAFHRGLVNALVEICAHSGVRTVALSGGCFQNALLRQLAETQLQCAGFNVLAARDLPPNDGVIAAGQALGALWQLTTVTLPQPPAAAIFNQTPTP